MNVKAKILAAVVAICMGTVAPAKEVKGKVTHVRDADTIEVRGVPVRFDGVDAPDKGQSGFKEGKAWMKSNYAGRMVRCVLTGVKTYDRWVGTCLAAKARISAPRLSAQAGLETALGTRGVNIASMKPLGRDLSR